MTHFLSAGTIASEILRKETRNGVVATFRLRAGSKGRGQVWIDVESWGHLAGTIHQHGRNERAIIVSGRLTQKTWRDNTTGDARHRYVITATDIDFLPDGYEVELPNEVVASGIVDTTPTTRSAGTGTVTEFRLASGRAGTKTGRLWIAVEHWHRDPLVITRRAHVAIAGHLAFGRKSGNDARLFIKAVTLACAAESADDHCITRGRGSLSR